MLAEFATGGDRLPVDAVLENRPILSNHEVGREAPRAVLMPAIIEAFLGLIKALDSERWKSDPRGGYLF